MQSRQVTEEDRYRCVVLAHYKVINKRTRTLHFKGLEIEIDPECPPHKDTRATYEHPVIKEGNPLEVRVYDGKAVNLERRDLLGDFRDALDRCHEAVEKERWTVVPL